MPGFQSIATEHVHFLQSRGLRPSVIEHVHLYPDLQKDHHRARVLRGLRLYLKFDYFGQ